ncbi:hypothetical protein [Actinoplanes sp. NPDC051851]|uniref:hypothetical protein n=1 Tax=Actinoplanes sp. NPDC051851 TaxID=3154753 RepID=UPI003421B187
MIRRILVPAALILTMSACANGGTEASAPAVGSTPSTESAIASSAAGVPSAPTRVTSTAGSTTITGTVTEGVEPNCLLLQDADGVHLLVFGDAALRAQAVAGTKVSVVGKPQPGMMTTCQQGEPFAVSSVTPE